MTMLQAAFARESKPIFFTLSGFVQKQQKNMRKNMTLFFMR